MVHGGELVLAWRGPARRELARVLQEALRSAGLPVELRFASGDAGFEQASAILALDEGALAQALAVGVPRVGLLRDAWWEPVARDDISFELQAYGAATEAKAPLSSARCGAIPTPGYEPPEDLATARAVHKIPEGARVVLLSASALSSESLSAWMIQLALVGGEVFWLLHVGRDAELAERLRSQTKTQALRGGIFAEGADCASLWRLADVVVAGRDASDISRGLAVGAPVLSLEVDPPDDGRSIARVDSLSMLAVELEAVMEPRVLEERRAAVRNLCLPGSVERAARAVIDWFQGPDERANPLGLPLGLERLDSGATRPDSGEASAPDALESKVERELAALKARLEGSGSE